MLLTAKLVDEVHYSERGNEVFLVKHLDKLRGRAKAPARGDREEARATIHRTGHRRHRTGHRTTKKVEVDQES